MSIVSQPYTIYVIPLWHDIAYLCWKCRWTPSKQTNSLSGLSSFSVCVSVCVCLCVCLWAWWTSSLGLWTSEMTHCAVLCCAVPYVGADAWISVDTLSCRRAQTVPHLSQPARVIQRRHQFILPHSAHSQLPAGQSSLMMMMMMMMMVVVVVVVVVVMMMMMMMMMPPPSWLKC